jgi:hypothetical protein
MSKGLKITLIIAAILVICGAVMVIYAVQTTPELSEGGSYNRVVAICKIRLAMRRKSLRNWLNFFPEMWIEL